MQPVVGVTVSTGIPTIASLKTKISSTHRLFWPKIHEIIERRAVAGHCHMSNFQTFVRPVSQISFRVETWNFRHR